MKANQATAPLAKSAVPQTGRWQLVIRAGWVRVVFAVVFLLMALGLIPSPYQTLSLRFGASLVYVVCAIVFQVLIYRGIGRGDVRAFLMGLVDLAFLTFLVQRLGSTTTVLPFIYLLIPVMNAVSSRSQVAMSLAILGSIMYAAVLMAEGMHWVTFAPWAPPEAAVLGESIPSLFASGGLVVASVLVTTALVNQLIRALNRANEQLKRLSLRDELTKLYNRRHFLEKVDHQMEHVRRGGSMALMMIDLDGFKQVNDEQGHDAGDNLLRAVANVLEWATRKVDIVARYGGDEFVVMLLDTGRSGCARVAGRVAEGIRDAGWRMYPATPVTASIGTVLAHEDDDALTLLCRADQRAYQAKRAGGNRVCSQESEGRPTY